MSQPVKLSDALVLDARLAAEQQERSIAGQVEYWAKLGRSIDDLMKGPQAQALRRSGDRESLAERLASVDTPAGRARVEAYLKTRPFPHFEEGPEPGLLIRIDEDGTRTTGRFVNRVFVPVDSDDEAKAEEVRAVLRQARALISTAFPVSRSQETEVSSERDSSGARSRMAIKQGRS